MSSPAQPDGLAFKAYEIEEWVDVHGFRRLGILVARAARTLGLSPNAVSIVSGLCGMIGGLLLVSDPWVPLGVAMIVGHGVFDSADGQLARMTGRTSEWGRVLDGAGGYVTHAAAYIAIAVRTVAHGGSWWVVPLGLAAGAMTAVHAQMYDYHRTTYAAVVLKGIIRTGTGGQRASTNPIVGIYEGLQRRCAGLHPEVVDAVERRAPTGVVREEDRARYRRSFYRLVRAWNACGDNVRRAGFIVLAWTQHLGWYFAFILVPLNLWFAVVWIWQRRADRRFLAEVSVRE